MSRISNTFSHLQQQGRKALIPFFTAGDPNPSDCVPIMHALVAGGANIIELGVPFSDPMADGPVIQRSSERALKHGVTLRDVIGYVADFRCTNTHTPIVLFGYANPIESMGLQQFAKLAKAAGVDGVLVVDYPLEEATTLVETMDAEAIDTVFLISPTTSDARLAQVVTLGRGYLYYVSLKGVTGAANIDVADVAQRLTHIRQFTSLPLGVGFGIRDGETAGRIAKIADAVVIGSRLVQDLERAPLNAVDSANALMTEIRLAMDQQVLK